NPGALVKSYSNVVPTAKNIVGTNYGFNFYDMVFTLPTSTTLSAGVHWLAIQTAGGQGLNYWAITNSGYGAPGKYSTDAGASWVSNSSFYNFSFRVDGLCLDLTEDPSTGPGIECLLVCSSDQTF